MPISGCDMQRPMSKEEINRVPCEGRRDTNPASFRQPINFDCASYVWPRDISPAPFECHMLRDINPVPFERTRQVTPVSFVWERDISPPPLVRLSGAFRDDTCIDIKRRFEILDEIIRVHEGSLFHLQNFRKRIRDKPNQRIEDLARQMRRTKHTISYMSVVTKKMARKGKVNSPVHRNIRQAVEYSPDNLCKAVQGMQLNPESSVRLSECSGDNFVAKVDGPSEIAEDLSKLCMKD